jgi:hypothetical protein
MRHAVFLLPPCHLHKQTQVGTSRTAGVQRLCLGRLFATREHPLIGWHMHAWTSAACCHVRGPIKGSVSGPRMRVQGLPLVLTALLWDTRFHITGGSVGPDHAVQVDSKSQDFSTLVWAHPWLCHTLLDFPYLQGHSSAPPPPPVSTWTLLPCCPPCPPPPLSWWR